MYIKFPSVVTLDRKEHVYTKQYIYNYILYTTLCKLAISATPTCQCHPTIIRRMERSVIMDTWNQYIYFMYLYF